MANIQRQKYDFPLTLNELKTTIGLSLLNSLLR